MASHPNSLSSSEVGEKESIELLVSKLPGAQDLSEAFVECTTELSVSATSFLECTTELPAFPTSASDPPTGNMEPLQFGSTGASEVPCSGEETMQSNCVGLPGLNDTSQPRDTISVRNAATPGEVEVLSVALGESVEPEVPLERTTEEREKIRTFPVLLSGGESGASETSSNTTLGFNCEGNLGRADCDVSGNGNGLISDKDSGSDSEGDDCKIPSSSNATHVLSSKEKQNSMKDEPLQGMLESKIAELEHACTGLTKAEEDDDLKTVRVRKRQLKEIRVLLEGTDRSSEEKLRHLNAKYSQQVAETRKMEKDFVILNRKCKQVNKEKDTIYAELTKSTALRQKLESLCRELQRQNKLLLDDSKRMASEEEQKRQELSGKFHNTVKDITTKLEEQGDERLRQLEENELLREKLKHFTQQYDIREQHFAHQLRTKSLEYQLLEVKLKQQEDLCLQAESKTRMYTEQISQLLKTEQELRSQLALYGDKFEHFQETLTKSNEVFATFKTEMEKMSKTVKKLEKENSSLKKKCEKSDVSIIDLLGERDILKKQLQTTRTHKEKLEGLCRSLQAERKQLIAVDISHPSLPSQLDNLKLSNPE